MAISSNYTGNVQMIDGLMPTNGQDYPLMDAHYVMINNQRLDDKLDNLVEEVLRQLPYAEEVSV